MNKTLLLLLAIGLFFMACNTPSGSNSDKTSATTQSPSNDIETNATNDKSEKDKLTPKSIVDSVMIKRFEAAKKEPPTEKQKAVGSKICDCMNSVKLYSKIFKAKTQEEFDKIAGDNALEDVIFIQSCHSKFMKPAIKDMELSDAGIFSLKARSYLEKQCMNSNSQLWFLIGKYISTHRPKEH